MTLAHKEFGTFDTSSPPRNMQQSDAPKARKPPLAEAPQRHSRQCLEKAITVWGWTFDAFLVLVNLTDVVSDCLIARQFWRDGHTTFFWLVIASLTIASLIYTFVGVEYLLRERLRNRLPRIVQYPLMLILSQLVPVLNWVLELIKPQSVGSEVGGWSNTFGKDRSDFTTGVAAQEIGSMQRSAHVMERLDVALAHHLRSHALLYVESVVEAIPQSIVQLLAVSFLGEASTLQVFSLALSMISIMSKGYVLSRSFAVPEIVYKFLLGCFDLFSLFYVFSTVLSNMSSRDVEIGDGVFVDYLSFIWLLKLLAFWGSIALCGSVVGLYALYSFVHSSQKCSVSIFGQVIGLGFLGALGVVPVIIAVDGAKMLWVNFFLTEFEPPTTCFPSLSLWYGFCNGAPTTEEFYNRFRYVCLRLIDQHFSVHALSNRKIAAAKGTRRMRQHHDSAVQRTCAAASQFNVGTENVWLVERARPLRQLVANVPEHVRIAVPFLTAPVLRPLALARALNANRFRNECSRLESPEDACKVLVGITILCMYALGQVYSMLFPFLHFTINHAHQNLLQCFCFYGAAATMSILLCFIPRLYRYVMFLAMSYHFSRTMLAARDGCAKLESFIEDYFIPQPAHFIASEVDPHLLPHDLVGVVASFLQRKDLDLRAVTIEDCRQVSKNMIMNEYRFDVPSVKGMSPPTDAAATDDAQAVDRSSDALLV